MNNDSILLEDIKKIDPFVFFIITRTYNKNTVCISANIDKNNNIIKSNPINPYWIMFEKDLSGKMMEPLTTYENNFGYGYNLKDTNWPLFNITIVATPSLVITCNSETHECYGFMDNIKYRILKVNVVCSESFFGLFPTVDFIDVHGLDKNGENIKFRLNS